MMSNNFFITTPIYYTNWVPHIWHAYSSLIAQVIFNYKKITWFDIKFSTWVDENSQKVLPKALESNMSVSDYLDMMAQKHKSIWSNLGITYTDFIRTTDERHHKLVKEVLQKSFDNWDIYEWFYEWKYCVWCEAFKKEDDLIELNWKKICPDHLVEPQNIKEKNYFFKLSKYSDKLKEFYLKNPEFVRPKERFNEVISFVERWLEDFSISRETNTFGIKLPFDESQVTYVWYDALFNYLTVCKTPDNWEEQMQFWPPNVHVVWKDIVRFHAIYWPAMLMSAGYELPKTILTTGYFTIDWQKISKSLWNVIDPVEFIQQYNKELLLLYLLDSFHIWQDGDFNEKQAILMYNAKLANNLWNLLNRVLVLQLKTWINHLWENIEIDSEIQEKLIKYNNDFEKYFENYLLKDSLDTTFWFLDELNKYADNMQPWKMIKDESIINETQKVLYSMAEWLRIVWLNLYAFFPEKMWEMFDYLWLSNYNLELSNWNIDNLKSQKTVFIIDKKPEILFKKIDIL